MEGKNYFITSKRLGFSKWGKENFSLAQKLWGNIEVTKLIDSRGKLNNDQVKEKLDLEITNEKKYGMQYFPIFTLQNDEFIGCCGLRPYDLSNRIYEIGFHLIPTQWKKGYASEAANRMIKYAFEEMDAYELFAGHNPNNYASKQLLTKLGFKYIGDEFFEPTGLNHPSYKFTNYQNVTHIQEDK